MRGVFASAAILVVLALTPSVASAKLHKVYVKSVGLSQTTAAPGTPIQVNYVVGNRGMRESGRRTVRFFLTLSAAKGFKGTSLGSAKVPAGIEPKSTRSARKRITIPPNTAAGAYLVMACISGKCKSTTVRVVVIVPSFGVAQLVINPSTYDFGPVESGSPQTTTFTVTNVGTAASGVITMFKADDIEGNGQEFLSFANNGCDGNALAPAASCQVDLTYSPEVCTSVNAVIGPYAVPGANPQGSVFATIDGTEGPAPLHFGPTPRC